MSRLQRSHGFKVARRSKRALIRDGVPHTIEDSCFYEKEFVDQFAHDQKIIQQDIIDFYTDTGGSADGVASIPSNKSIQSELGDFASLKKSYDALAEVGEQYKEIIRMQDKRYAELQAKNQELKSSLNSANVDDGQANETTANEYVDHLKDSLHQSENRIRELERHVNVLKDQADKGKIEKQQQKVREAEDRIRELEEKVNELTDLLQTQPVAENGRQSPTQPEGQEKKVAIQMTDVSAQQNSAVETRLLEAKNRISELEMQIKDQNSLLTEQKHLLNNQPATSSANDAALQESESRVRELEAQVEKLELKLGSQPQDVMNQVSLNPDENNKEAGNRRNVLDNQIELPIVEALREFLNSAELRLPNKDELSSFCNFVTFLRTKFKDICNTQSFLDCIKVGMDLCITYEEFEKAEQLARISMEISVGLHGPEDDKTKELDDKIVFLEERRKMFHDYGETQHTINDNVANDNAYDKLLEEHTGLLVLIANQELNKSKLLERIRTLGGEEEFDQAQIELGRTLIEGFNNSTTKNTAT